MTETVRAPFRGLLGLDVRTGWLLLGVFCTVRFSLVLYANAGGGYGLVTLIFILMAATPVVLLTKEGRRRIGLVRPRCSGGMVAALVAGALSCLVLAAVFHTLFAGDEGDAFAYVARAYPLAPGDPTGRLVLFGVVAAMSILFSPIGEELFFRGLIHESFKARWGEGWASVLDAASFALVHLSHFGLVWTAMGWRFLPAPALLWLAGMFGAALVFSWARRRTGSIWGALTAHAAFNLMMTTWIFLVVI